MNNAVYVVNLGTDDAPRCRTGVCALVDVPKDAALVVTSSNAEAIFNLVLDIVPRHCAKTISHTEVETDDSVHDAISYVRAACDVDRIGQTPSHFNYEIVKMDETPDPPCDFGRKSIDAFNAQAGKLTSAIHDAIAEAAERGEELESVFFGGKFSAMSDKPKFVYRIEFQGREDVVVGGEMTFALNQPGPVLRISEKEINLCGRDGFNGAAYSINDELERQMVDALVAFFVRCHEKRM